jgi:fluoroacetyl-CoA thioesterase
MGSSAGSTHDLPTASAGAGPDPGQPSRLAPGLSARVQLTVTDADTAQALGSGDVPVLGTPRVLALAEAATVAATVARLDTGMSSVGVRVEIDHKAAVPVGGAVVADATLTKVDGRRLLFEIMVRYGQTVVAEGRIERVVVNRHRFMENAFGGA